MVKTGTYFVKVYFDNMLDESYKFNQKDKALAKLAQLSDYYAYQRLYRVTFEEV